MSTEANRVDLSRGPIHCTITGTRALPHAAYDVVAALALAIEAADEDLARVLEQTEDT